MGADAPDVPLGQQVEERAHRLKAPRRLDLVALERGGDMGQSPADHIRHGGAAR
jgi:hypothetical protein